GAFRHVRMGTQTALEIIPADIAQQRIVRVAVRPSRFTRQLGRQGVNRHHRVKLGAEEEGDGEALLQITEKKKETLILYQTMNG
ncbi:hypothetical protein NP570_24170, partial [Vibrio parahaemolyticus]|nr:hypothetical protein [Vibrio parahaemolyticus]